VVSVARCATNALNVTWFTSPEKQINDANCQATVCFGTAFLAIPDFVDEFKEATRD